MIEKVDITNFRSIEKTSLELGGLTVFYGPTAAGKSSPLYALCVLRNFILNPNQASDGLFNLGFQNLGGFDACTFNHDAKREISIYSKLKCEAGNSGYGLTFGKNLGRIRLDSPFGQITDQVAIPYAMNQTFSHEVRSKKGPFTVNWNGIAASVVPAQPNAESQAEANELAQIINAPAEEIKRIDIAPHRRGFFKPNYTPVPLSPLPTFEDEVATLIINDQNLPPKISIDTEEIFGRDFRTFTPPGTATVYFQTTDKKARTPGYLVNDGFGVNQVVYLLAKIHRADTHTLLIEEPEAHLHPRAIRNLARTLCRIAGEDRKQFLFTTHSEQFIGSLLTCVAESLLPADQLRVYYVTRETRSTIFEPQSVGPEGQVSGGLKSFVEVELEDLKKLLSVAQ